MQGLFALGADLNAKMRDGTTPLMLAATHGHERMVSWLIEQGADVKMKAYVRRLACATRHVQDGRTALVMATDNQLWEMANLLKDLGAHGAWSTGLFGNIQDLEWWQWIFPCVPFGMNMESQKQDCCCWGLLYSVACFGTPVASCCLAAHFRSGIRERYLIPGHPVTDRIVHLFCHCCALAQERHMLKTIPWEAERGRAVTITSPLAAHRMD